MLLVVSKGEAEFTPENSYDAFLLGQIFQKAGSGNIQMVKGVDKDRYEIASLKVPFNRILEILTA